jgi:hypothetical protein
MGSTPISSNGLNLVIREWRFKRRMRAANSKYDAFVVSLPKSGRTWHRVMLGYYLARLVGEDPRGAMKLDLLCKKGGCARVAYSHNGTSISDKLPIHSEVLASPDEWRGRAMLLLVRDPRDLLVSAYHNTRFRKRSFDGTLSDYIRHPFVGIEKLLVCLNLWHENSRLAAKFDVLSYEAMVRDPAAALRSSLAFIGVPHADPAIVAETVKFASFQNMRRLEQTDYFKSTIMRPLNDDPRGNKVREGKVGAYREHLSDSDLEFIESVTARIGNPFAASRKQSQISNVETQNLRPATSVS